MASKPLTHNDYTVGWVCALPKEQTAATAMLDREHDPLPTSDHNTYTLGSVGNHNIVIACLPFGRIGNNSSATVATRMIATFPSIKFGLMVGIGGGIPPKVRLGDVVVSTPKYEFPGVVQWDMGKAEEGGNFKRTGSLNSPPSALLTALTKLETQHEMKGPKMPQYLDDLKKNWPLLAPTYTRSDSLKDVLFAPDNPHRNQSRWQVIFAVVWQTILAFLAFLLGWRAVAPTERVAEQVASPTTSTVVDGGRKSSVGVDGDEQENDCRFCNMTKVIKREPRDMCVHYGLIASGNQVIKDAKLRDNLNKSLGGNILCVEMEAAGLMNDFPCIVIRGICDYGDSHKNKTWQEHAAAVAAAFAKELLSVVPVQDVERMPNIKKIENAVNELRSRQRDQDHEAILNWLTPVDYAPQHNDFISRRQAGTGQWFLDSDEFQAWLEMDKQTLFCPGIPGAGKTIITAIVIDDLYSRFLDDQSTGIAYIYCNFRRQHERKVEDLLESLLKQLAQRQSSLPASVKDLYDRHKKNRTRPSFDEISRTLHSVAATYSRAFIIVDALDECQVSDRCRERFLSELFNFQDKTGANLFATSRPTQEIEGEFKERSIILKLSARNEDVEKYLDDHMSSLPLLHERNKDIEKETKEKFRGEIKTIIVGATNGMFLLAHFHLESLKCKTTLRDLSDALERLPKGEDALANAYGETIERIRSQSTDFRFLAERVLSLLTCAERLLTKLELRDALAVRAGTPTLDKDERPCIGTIVKVCAGLVTFDEESGIVRLVHDTTRAYLADHMSCIKPQKNPATLEDPMIFDVQKNADAMADAQNTITIICVTYLSFNDFTSGFSPCINEFKERLRLNPLYDYAARNWGHHARQTQIPSQTIMPFLTTEAKVEASSQVIQAFKFPWFFSGNRMDDQLMPTSIKALHILAYFGLREAMECLLADGHDPNTKDHQDRTPLLWAAEKGHTEVIEVLLKGGADLEAKDRHKQSSLCRAVMHRQEAVVRLLLQKGADFESKDLSGRTPLSFAMQDQHGEIVKLLHENGAGLYSKDEHGLTPENWQWASDR